MKEWYVQENITAFSIKQKTNSRTRLDSCICSLSKNSHLKDEAKINANLIAAAPEMLTMLEHLNFSGGLGMETHKEIARIISKAKGE